jgi:hypothetical protein
LLPIVVATVYALLRRATRNDADRLREDLADLTAVLDATTGRAEDEVIAAFERAYIADGIAQAEQYLGEVR